MNVREDNERHTARAPGAILLALGAVAIGGLLAVNLMKMARERKGERRHAEKLRDKSLKDTFPASDPPASQYFDIPVNRQ